MAKFTPILICATNTGVGKSFSTTKIIDYLNSINIDTVGFKPIETGVFDTAQDCELLLKHTKQNIKYKNLEVDDINCYKFSLPAAPYIAKDKKIKLKNIKTKLKKLEKISDVVMIESAGGLMTPIKKNFFMIDLANYLNAKVLLITPSRLGCINETMLCLELLKHRDIKYEWCINIMNDKDDFFNISYNYYHEKFGDVLFLDRDIKKIVERLLDK
ncbi:MAG: dethiobiotin synthase [Campylobacterales bacterium]|nr:dethiobiotin synthase [Campylobacterales bacterium]